METVKPSKQRLPYYSDSAELFAPIADKNWAVFLDSGFPYSEQGRYDIIAYNPEITLLSQGNTTKISKHGEISYSNENPFLLVKKFLKTDFPSIAGIPFNGGAIGYFSYDLVRRLEHLPTLAKDEENIADMAIGIYAWAVVVDHHQQESWLVGKQQDNWQNLINQFSLITTEEKKSDFWVLEKPQSNMDKKSYQLAFEKIKSYLKEGDSYQVNLAQRFSSPCSGNPWFAYKQLRKINSAPFSAYLNFSGAQILSSSPERFLKLTDGKVESKPIKGTRPRHQQIIADQQQISALSKSPKDRAENLMIVDLLRNDISKNCQKWSVKVPKLFEIESYAMVHHLVSTITGILADGQHALDLLKNCFPGGSITGAPKIRAMEIIEELEPNRRGIYCGSIGYIGFDGNMDTNIAIRTLVHSEHKIRFWAGGGIVNDSKMEAEYQECFDKAAALLKLLQQFC